MKKESILFGLIGLLIGIIIMGFVASYAINYGHNGMLGMMGVDGNRMTSSNIDRNFIEQMIPHHESAIVMAKLAQQKSSRSEVKSLAGNIITSQTAEIDKMKAWYKQWYGVEVPKQDGSNDMGGMMHGSRNESDLSAAADFDKAFLAEMIAHHQMAVMMANMLENSTKRQEMKTLAQDIATTQSEEIDTMRNWQVQWGYVTSKGASSGMMHAMH